uniref:NADH dehydrogenase subunit 6 n=1 Tax=Platygaster sp. ZJUH_2016026 TaxID=2491166 RepID=A0A3Q8UA93_9HYME|nr:NADH dehydrogenase subunit 6 [Platygaster sp. ZJUH_2016026]
MTINLLTLSNLLLNSKNYFIMNIYMMLMMITINMIYNFFIFHPLNLNMLILFMMLNSTLFISIYKMHSWYSFMIFLIIISGLMILFMYFMNFAINEYSILLKHFMMLSMIKLNFMLLLLINFNNIYYLNFIFNKLFYMYYLPLKFINKSIIYIWMKINFQQPIFLIMYLLIFLIIISYLCKMKKLMIRQIKN